MLYTSKIDWMLPGVEPTGRKVEIHLIAIVQFVDGIYVVTITGTGDAAKVTFSHERERLDGQPDACPG